MQHKSEIMHPAQEAAGGTTSQFGVPSTAIPGVEEVFLKAGSAVLFNDFCLHGASPRANPGERRTLVFRCEFPYYA